MYQIAIISDLHDWHTKQIEIYLKKIKCKVKILKFNDIKLNFCEKRKKFFNYNLSKIDAVWVRFLGGQSLEEITTKLTYLHLLNDLKIYIHNSADTIEKTVDKVRTTGLLKINGIQSPDTSIWIGKDKRRIKENSLIKPIFGSQGKGIKLVKKNTNINKLEVSGNVFYLQRFLDRINQLMYSDFRVLVSNHRVIASMKRESKDFLTNVFQGASYSKIELNENVLKLAEKVSKIFKLGYGGIDIKINNNKVFVLEVNSIPSWKNIDKLYSIDLTEKLVNDFVKIIKKFKKCQNN